MSQHPNRLVAGSARLCLFAVMVLAATCCTPARALSDPLPDGRAYELVSPSDKNGGDITGDGHMVVASASGDAVEYSSRASFADTAGTGGAGQTQYVARRSAAGWTTHAITPTPAREAIQLFVGSTQIATFSDELEAAIMWAYDLPEVSGDTPQMLNIYREDTAARTFEPITVSQAEAIGFGDFFGAFWGASSDTRHISLVTQRRLLPEAPSGVPTVYEWTNGVLHIAGVLPDGTIPAEGSDVAPKFYRSTVTPDGSRVLFVSPPSGDSQLYMRVEGSRTVWISQPENSGFTGTPAEVMLQAVSGDGRHVLFTTTSRLLPEDQNDGPDLYRYTDSVNPATDSNLTLISHTGDIDGSDQGGAVLGTSADASRIYFDDLNGHLYLWDHGAVTMISDSVPRSYGGNGTLLSASDSQPGAARVSADGAHLAFLTNATTGNDQVHALTGETTDAHVEMYAYDAAHRNLTCCSCPREGVATSDARVDPDATVATASSSLLGQRPRFLTADGRHVFFSTADALVPSDTNGVADTYECDTDTGTVARLSSGRSAEGSWFVDASTSGNDVFMVTRAQLVRADRDALVDLYDVRVGGGFPEPAPQPQPCQGDQCQGGSSAPPVDLSIGTETFVDSREGRRVQTGAIRVLGSHGLRGLAARLTLRVSEPGKLSWLAVGMHRGTRHIQRPGTYSVVVRLVRSAKLRLLRTGVYHVRLTLRFTASQGEAGTTTATARLTFKTIRISKGR